MAVTPLNPEVKVIDLTVFRPEEDGSRKLGMHYAWWDQGIPTKQYYEYVAPPGATAEEGTNFLIAAANDAWDVAHEV